MIGEMLETFLSEKEVAAVRLLHQELGIDVTRTHQFWEALLSRITTGSLTNHQSAWDIDLLEKRIEVKSSSEFLCSFRSGVRPVFKFGRPQGVGKSPKPVDALVLIGISADNLVYSWVLPANRIRGRSSITLTSPRYRNSNHKRYGKGYDEFACPPSQLLPEILRACHLTYDAKHHA